MQQRVEACAVALLAHLRKVILPHLARNLVAAQIKCAELDLRDGELLRGRMLRRVVLRKPLILEHVQQRCFASIVEAEEQDLGVLCLLYTSPSPRDATLSRMPSSA